MVFGSLLHCEMRQGEGSHFDSRLHIKFEEGRGSMAVASLQELVQLVDVLQLGVAVEQQGGVVCGGQALYITWPFCLNTTL